MEKDIIDIITEKQFIELSSVEREELQEFCANEDEYNHLRDVMLGVNSLTFEKVSPKKETKQKLDDLFNETYPKVAPVWYMSVLAVVVPKEKTILQQPLLKVAAVCLLILLAYPIFNNDVVTEENQIAELTEVNKEDNALNEGEIESEVESLSEDVATNEQPKVDEDLILPSDQPESFGSDTRTVSPPISSGLTISDIVAGPTTVLTGTTSLGSNTTTFTATGAAAPGVNHPDGIFDASGDLSAVSSSTSAAETPDVFDLLTPTF